MVSKVSIVARDGNTKRRWLCLNRCLGKYLPSHIEDTIRMYDDFSAKVTQAYNKDALIISFAESSTALGFYTAAKCNLPFIHTTRYPEDDRQYLCFDEEHSHLKHHYVDKAFLDNVLPTIKTVIFVEDEITTGRTLENAKQVIMKTYPDLQVLFVAATLVMCKSLRLSMLTITCEELPDSFYEDDFSNCEWRDPRKVEDVSYTGPHCIVSTMPCVENSKHGVYRTKDYIDFNIDIKRTNGDSVLVLGTEECWYPALVLCQKLKNRDCYTHLQMLTRTALLPGCYSYDTQYDRYDLLSLYNPSAAAFIYNVYNYDYVYIVTDANVIDKYAISLLRKAFSNVKNSIQLIQLKYTNTSYSPTDVTPLFTDLTNKIEPLELNEREKLIQSGEVHYSETVPVEPKHTDAYYQTIDKIIDKYALNTASCAKTLGMQLINKFEGHMVLVSLARAGIPAAILVKHYIDTKMRINVPHYAISIIKDKGIDRNALNHILSIHPDTPLVFTDGWVGKGTIYNELAKSIDGNIEHYFAALSDPTYVSDFAGTHYDVFIPHSALNSTISGLMSRTIRYSDLIGPNDYDGVVYYPEFINDDRSNKYISAIDEKMESASELGESIQSQNAEMSIRYISEHYLQDAGFDIKPGINETIRSLLRRVPEEIIISSVHKNDEELELIYYLAKHRDIPIHFGYSGVYKACSILRKLGSFNQSQ